MTSGELQGLVFPPQLSANTKQVTADKTNPFPTQSNLKVCCIISLAVRLVGSEPKGGEALSKSDTTRIVTAPTGTLI